MPERGGQLTWIPWDHNMALAHYPMGSLSLGMDEIGDEWPLIRLLLDDVSYAAAYRQELAAAVTGPFALQAFADRALQLQALIAPHVEAEQTPYTQLESIEAFEQSVGGPEGLVEHASARHQAVQAFLAQK